MSRLAQNAYDINQLFSEYATAVENNDTKAIAVLYALPCTFLSNEGSSMYNDLATLEGSISQGRRFYKKHGIKAARPDVRHKYTITDRIVRVKVNWKYVNSKEEEVYNCDYEYIVKKHNSGEWKIEYAISINEQERLQALSKK